MRRDVVSVELDEVVIQARWLIEVDRGRFERGTLVVIQEVEFSAVVAALAIHEVVRTAQVVDAPSLTTLTLEALEVRLLDLAVRSDRDGTGNQGQLV